MRKDELLAGLAPRGPVSLMYRMYRYVLPDVRRELDRLREMAERIPDGELRKQALASMRGKRFHCEGGAVYAAAHLAQRRVLVPLIVTLQTISDYLDNLCDRSTSLDAGDFRLLHQSMIDAVTPGAEPKNYYALRREQDDGGYLHALVRQCQSCIDRLPAYSRVRDHVRRLVGLYRDLQVYKHIAPHLRERYLLAWWEEHRSACPELMWNEFAAATGSTLGMFMLFLAATDPGLERSRADSIVDAYFPFICCLHIMLDYLIDQAEDEAGGDLNFCRYYRDGEQLTERLLWIVERARQAASGLPSPRFHRMVVEGLIALYLSDPKIRNQQRVLDTARAIMRGSPLTRIFFWLNSRWIRNTHTPEMEVVP